MTYKKHNTLFFLLLLCLQTQAELPLPTQIKRVDSLLAVNNCEMAIKEAEMGLEIAKRSSAAESALLFLNIIFQCKIDEPLEGEKALKEAFDHVKKHPELQSSGEYLVLLNNASIYEKRKGNHPKASKYLERAIQKIDKSVAPILFHSKLYNNNGVLAARLSDHEKALRYYKKALELRQQLLPSQKTKVDSISIHKTIATSHNNIAQIHNLLAEYAQAEKALRQTLEIHEKYLTAFPNMRVSYGRYCINFAHHFQLREMYDSAAVYLARAKEFIGGNHTQAKRYHKFLGVNYLRQGKYTLAQQQLNISEKYDSYSPKSAGGIYRNQAEIRLARGDTENALLQLHFALKCYAKFETRLPTLKQIKLKPEALETLIQTARILGTQGLTSESPTEFVPLALATYSLAIDLLHELRQSFDGRQSKQFLSKKYDDIYEEALALAYDLYQQTQDKKQLRIAFRIAEQSKAAHLLEAANQAEALGHSALPQQLRDSLSDLKFDIAYFDKKADKKSNTEQQQKIDNRLFQLKQEKENLLKFIEKNYPSYYQLKHQATVFPLDSIQANLCSENRDLVSYFYGKKAIYVFHLQAKEIDFYAIEKKENTDRDLLDFIQLVSSKEATITAAGLAKFKQLARDIYLTFGELCFSSQAESTLIIPDGPLAFLPFDLLLYTSSDTATSYADLPYLLHKKILSYAFSASLATRSPRDRAASKGILVLAPYPKQLRYSQAEMDYLQQIAATKTLIGEQATTANFLAKAKEYQVLHLSTHAKVSGEPTIQFHEGALALSMLFALNLKADLAVLSVCEGNLGQDQAGEGVQSLASGFAYAGVPSLLASLWAVNDRATSDILQSYYTQLAVGADKATALQKAKTTYLEQVPNEALASPYYWAAFVQLGDIASLNFKQKSNLSWYYLITFLAFPLLIFLLYRKK